MTALRRPSGKARHEAWRRLSRCDLTVEEAGTIQSFPSLFSAALLAGLHSVQACHLLHCSAKEPTLSLYIAKTVPSPHDLANMATELSTSKAYLLELPPEFRLIIYAYFLTGTKIYFKHVKGILRRDRGCSALSISITATCHQPRIENCILGSGEDRISISDRHAIPNEDIIAQDPPVKSPNTLLYRTQNLYLSVRLDNVTASKVIVMKQAAHTLF